MTRDEGLQAERTLLAWGRTLVTFLVASLLLLRWLPRHGDLVLLLISSNLGFASIIWLTNKRRYLRLTNTMDGTKGQSGIWMIFGLSGMSLSIAFWGIILLW